jgi:membrane protein implicated in regulation of membrane protease activity
MESLAVAPWIIWLIVAVASFILEIFIPGFWVAILGIGALAAAPLAALGAGTAWQILVFAVVSVIAGIFFRPLALKYFFKSSEKREANTNAMIGRKAKVISKITADEPGKAKIGSEVWTAVPENEGDTFEEGSMVEITAVDGAKIIVRSHQ